MKNNAIFLPLIFIAYYVCATNISAILHMCVRNMAYSNKTQNVTCNVTASVVRCKISATCRNIQHKFQQDKRFTKYKMAIISKW